MIFENNKLQIKAIGQATNQAVAHLKMNPFLIPVFISVMEKVMKNDIVKDMDIENMVLE